MIHNKLAVYGGTDLRHYVVPVGGVVATFQQHAMCMYLLGRQAYILILILI
jgi:hypothetical protein